MKLAYKVRHVSLPARGITNLCRSGLVPQFITAYGDGWFEHPERFLLAEQMYHDMFDDANGHYAKLEQSILEKGIRDPVCVTADVQPRFQSRTALTPRLGTRPMTMVEFLGGSRVHVAQKHGMEVPCLVSDFVEMYPEAPEINLEQAGALFTNELARIEFGVRGCYVMPAGFPHIGDPKYTMRVQSQTRQEIIRHILQQDFMVNPESPETMRLARGLSAADHDHLFFKLFTRSGDR